MSQIKSTSRIGVTYAVSGQWAHPGHEEDHLRTVGGTFRITTIAHTPQAAMDWAATALGVDIRVTSVEVVK